MDRQVEGLAQHRIIFRSRVMEKVIETAEERRTGYHAVITGYNGQTVHTVSGGQSVAVVGMSTVVSDGDGEGGIEGPVGYQPQVSVVQASELVEYPGRP